MFGGSILLPSGLHQASVENWWKAVGDAQGGKKGAESFKHVGKTLGTLSDSGCEPGSLQVSLNIRCFHTNILPLSLLER